MTTAEDIRSEFLDMVSDDTFGEDIVYVQGGVEYSIRAHVYRGGITSNPMRHDRGSESKPNKYNYEIRISNSDDTGRSTIITKTDSVKLAKDLGGDVFTMRVMEIAGQDPGTYKLGLTI